MLFATAPTATVPLDAGIELMPGRVPRDIPTDPPLVITWRDDLTCHSRDRLLAVATLLLERCRPALLCLDLGRCRYLSEEGVSALLSLWRLAEARGACLRVRALGQPRSKLAVTGVYELLAG